MDRWLELYPGLELKLDASTDWTPAVVESFADTKAVRIVDLKGLYEDVEVAQPADPELYRLVRDRFPGALLEDPKVTEETRPVLEPVSERVTWDKPIDSVESIRGLPFEPSTLNVKPSRFGSLRNLLEVVEFCLEGRIGMYGGGQFELGVGRGQIQCLASLFYPEAQNDVSPMEYHSGEPVPGAPVSPVQPPDDAEGFGWG
ncbi:MAG: o-succinylbenzoate synthase [Methanonatronarchaeales archaeon]|nr:o-succinylbenzoate synthase [Methanonatronarchaeales archaeon]